jgi:hypothetical protein
MRKRSYSKAVAIVSIVAILSLTAPGLFAGDTYRHFFRFERFLETPIHFLYSFLYFTPIYDVGKVLGPSAIENNNARQIKISGVLDVDRLSIGD